MQPQQPAISGSKDQEMRQSGIVLHEVQLLSNFEDSEHAPFMLNHFF